MYEGILDTLKSERGVREVALTDGVRAELEAWYEYSLGNPSREVASADALVVPSERDTPLSKNNIWRRNMQPRLKLVGLQWCIFQTMRRTFITLGKVARADPKVIAGQAVHDIGVSVSI